MTLIGFGTQPQISADRLRPVAQGIAPIRTASAAPRVDAPARMPETTDLAALARTAAALRNDAVASAGYGTPGSVPRGMLVDRLG